MNNFIYENKTKEYFGKDTVKEYPGSLLGNYGETVMLAYDGGSIKRNGVYDEIVGILNAAGKRVVEFSGIMPNPTYAKAQEGAKLARENHVDLILAVGGGSVSDCCKVISAQAMLDEDIWEMEYTKHALPTKFIPLGTIVTVFGTGSEMNNGAVISRRETKEKYPFYGNYPLFSILDPEKTFTLPQRQVACGLADTFVHVMEQYMTVAGQSRVMDRWAEGILQTLVEIAPEIRKNQHDYDLMADFMLSATMGLNGFIAMGVAQDWATHMIGHELTALHGLTHGATLAIVLPGTLRVLSAQKGDKLLQYGERVWGITTGERDERIRLAIERTEGFFRSLGLSTRLSEEGIGEETIAEIERRFDARGARYGEARNVDGAMARRILEACR